MSSLFGPSGDLGTAESRLCDSRLERSAWNHSKEDVSLQTQINSTRRRRRGGLGDSRRCQMFLRMDAHGVTPMPVPIRTAISLSKTSSAGAP